MNTITIYLRFLGKKQTIGLLICLFLMSGCEDFLETDNPTGQIPHEDIFEDEATATAAVTTMYAKLRDEVLVTGNTYGLGIQMGLYADELDYYGEPSQPLETFFQHQIIASDVFVSRIWNSSYNLIYMANTAIEGLDASQTLPEEIKDQLLGETLFIRAMTHFYLVNLFGDVPYITTTDYEVNSTVSRMQENLVYDNILTDLSKAKTLLGDTYVSGERTRANKWVISALLARVYLYLGQWENAENESSLLIGNTSLFNLANIEEEFLQTSPSAILQLKTKIEGFNTTEATTFVFVSGPPPLVALNEDMVEGMESNDLRSIYWVGEVTDGTSSWYYPNKYKQGTGLEYSVVFRLAEQYLIRAESRARQSNTTGARQDINTVRQRAGLQDTPASTTEELLQAILNERRFELFTEHGHRWFDIRRFGVAGEILSPIKPGWKPTDLLLPIPESELLMNPNLNPQNPGY